MKINQGRDFWWELRDMNHGGTVLAGSLDDSWLTCFLTQPRLHTPTSSRCCLQQPFLSIINPEKISYRRNYRTIQSGQMPHLRFPQMSPDRVKLTADSCRAWRWLGKGVYMSAVPVEARRWHQTSWSWSWWRWLGAVRLWEMRILPKSSMNVPNHWALSLSLEPCFPYL